MTVALSQNTTEQIAGQGTVPAQPGEVPIVLEKGSQEKTRLKRLECFCFAAHWNEQDLF